MNKKLRLLLLPVKLVIIVSLITLLFNIFIAPMILNRMENANFRLARDIRDCPYSPEEYQEGIFDCSNMANMLDDWLEMKGHESWIVHWRKLDGSAGHAMVLVNGKLVEPTRKILIESLIYFNGEPYMVDGTYSNMVTIIDEPSQLGSGYIESEWIYPERW